MTSQQCGQIDTTQNSLCHQAPAARPRRRRQTGSRARILATMRQLLCRETLGAVSLELVAREAKVTRRTIYNHFADREALYRASREELLSELEDRLAISVMRNCTPSQAVSTFCLELARAFAGTCYFELLSSLMCDGAQDWLAAEFDSRIRQPLQWELGSYLREQRARGACRIQDCDETASRLIDTIESIAAPVAALRTRGRSRPVLDEALIEMTASLFAQRNLGAAPRFARSQSLAA